MNIRRLHIDSFGKLKDYRLDLGPGFNLVYGPNEEGKSTLMGFIMMMLYGNSYTGRDMTRNLRLRFRPWDDSPMKGSLFLDLDRVSYRLTRTFYKSNSTDEIRLYKEISNEAVVIGKSPGESLLGLTSQEFEKSVFISQGGSVVGQSDNEGINERLANVASSGQEDISADKVRERLEKASVQLISRRGDKGRLVRVRQGLSALQDELAKAEAEEVEITGYRDRLARQRDHLRQKEAERARLQEEMASCRLHLRKQEVEEALEAERQRLALHEDLAAKAALLEGPRGPIRDQDLKDIQNRIQEIRDRSRERDLALDRLGKLEEEVRILLAEDREILSLERLEAVKGLAAEWQAGQVQLVQGREDARTLEAYLEAEEALNATREIKAGLDREMADLEGNIHDIQLLIEEEKARHDRLKDEETSLQQSLAGLEEDRLKQEDRLDHLAGLEEDLGAEGRGPWLDRKSSALCAGLTGLLSLALYFAVGPLALTGLLVTVGLLIYRFLQKNRDSTGRSGPARDHYQGLIRKERDQLAAIEARLSAQEESLAAERQKREEAREALFSLEEKLKEPRERQSELSKDLEDKRINCKLQEEKCRKLAESLAERGIKADWESLKSLEASLQRMEKDLGSLKENFFRQAELFGAQDLDGLVTRYHEDKNFLEIKTQKCELLKEERSQLAKLEGTLEGLFQNLNEGLGEEGPVACLEEAEIWLEKVKGRLEEVRRLGLQADMADRHRPRLAMEMSLEALEALNRQLATEISAREDRGFDPVDFKEEMDRLKVVEEGLREEAGKLERDLASLESEFKERFRRRTNVSQVEERIFRLEGVEASMSRTYEALKLARTTIDLSFDELQEDFGPRLNQLTAHNLSLLTGHKYKKVKVSRDLDLAVSQGEDSPAYSWQHLSGGTIDQAYLALRLAIIELVIQKDGTLPLFLDDVFAQYDDERATLGLAFLKEKTRGQDPGQTVLFTCHRHLVEKAEKLGGIHILSL